LNAAQSAILDIQNAFAAVSHDCFGIRNINECMIIDRDRSFRPLGYLVYYKLATGDFQESWIPLGLIAGHQDATS
jgi:hypothetical protein